MSFLPSVLPSGVKDENYLALVLCVCKTQCCAGTHPAQQGGSAAGPARCLLRGRKQWFAEGGDWDPELHAGLLCGLSLSTGRAGEVWCQHPGAQVFLERALTPGTRFQGVLMQQSYNTKLQ